MKIGIICEGRSDYPAITHFFGEMLKSEGRDVTFKALYPQMDRTRTDGGWANVLQWLNSNVPQSRVQRYFGGGLFGGELKAEILDAILIHLDSDVVEDESFRNFVRAQYGMEVLNSQDSEERGSAVASVIKVAAKFDDMTNSDCNRHVLAVAVDATEAWCVAAFHPQMSDYEALRGDALTNEFMKVLERSEGRDPKNQYSNCDKDFIRRARFCERHAQNADRVERSCKHFQLGLAGLIALD